MDRYRHKNSGHNCSALEADAAMRYRNPRLTLTLCIICGVCVRNLKKNAINCGIPVVTVLRCARHCVKWRRMWRATEGCTLGSAKSGYCLMQLIELLCYLFIYLFMNLALTYRHA